jgi:hypothetical protein
MLNNTSPPPPNRGYTSQHHSGRGGFKKRNQRKEKKCERKRKRKCKKKRQNTKLVEKGKKCVKNKYWRIRWEKETLFPRGGQIWSSEGVGQHVVFFDGVGQLWFSERVGIGKMFFSRGWAKYGFPRGWGKIGFPGHWGQKWLSEVVGSKMAFRGGRGIHSFPRANMAFRLIHTQTQRVPTAGDPRKQSQNRTSGS